MAHPYSPSIIVGLIILMPFMLQARFDLEKELGLGEGGYILFEIGSKLKTLGRFFNMDILKKCNI